MNKYELFRAFQEISPDLIEEADQLTVSQTEYSTKSAKKHHIFLRTHEEEIMGKHSKLFRTLTGAAAVLAVCSIGTAGYFAIRPQLADKPDDNASQVAEIPAGLTDVTAESTTASAVTTTAASDSPSDFVEVTLPEKSDSDITPVQDSDDNAFSEGEYVTYGAWFGNEKGYADKPVNVENGKKTSLNLNIMLANFDKQMEGKIPTSIILVQDGEVIPFSFDENGTPEIRQTIEMDIPKTQYSNILNLIVDAKGDRLNRIVDRLSEINGIQNIERHIYPDETYRAELYVTLTSDLITNDNTLYGELYEKIKKIYGITYISRQPVTVVHSDDGASSYVMSLGPSFTEKIWFTPHCKSEYSSLFAAIMFHYKNTDYEGDGELVTSAYVPLKCSNPDTSSDPFSACAVASADDYIDFPEDLYINGCTGIGIGQKQSYGSDAGPSKYSIRHYWYEEPPKIGRDEIYLKAHFDPRETFGTEDDQYTMSKTAYALLLCDNKPMGLAGGKDVVYFDTDTSKTLNFKLTLDDSIPDGVHEFSVVFVTAYDPESADNQYYISVFDSDSCRIEVHS